MDSREQATEKAKELAGDYWGALTDEIKTMLISGEEAKIDAARAEQRIKEVEQRLVESEYNAKLKDIYTHLKIVDTLDEDWESLAASYLTISPLDQSINDFNTSSVSSSVDSTIEYKKLLNSVIEACMSDRMTVLEAKQILDSKREEIMRVRKRNYDRQRNPRHVSIVREVQEKSSKLIKRGSAVWNYPIYEAATELMHIKDNYSVEIPTKEYVEHISSRMLKQIQSTWYRCRTHEHNKCPVGVATETKCVKECVEPAHLTHRSTITGYLVNGNFHSHTHKMSINMASGEERPGWYDRFKEYIYDIVLHSIESDNYEDEGCAQMVKVLQGYIVGQIESVDNWFHHEVKTVMRLNDFELFTANKRDVNCVQQCIEYLGYKYIGKSIEDTITDKKVVKYHPIDVSMDQVQKMDDLVMVYGFDNTNDCKNVVRVIECGDHMGLITKMWNRPIKNIITNRKINVSSMEKRVEVFVDIESFEDTNHNQVPYLICWQSVDSGIPSDVQHEAMQDCVKKFVDSVLEQHKGREIVMYAWYGSGYDYQHIFKYLKRHSLRDDTFIRNNQIIYAKIIFNDKTVIHLKDPYMFILCGLGKAAKAFGVTAKGEFPHQLVKGWNNLDEVLERWYFIREDFQDTYDESGKTVLITARTWKEFEEGENHMSILQKAIEYCTVDVIAMQQIWVKFVSTVKTELGVEIDVNTFTLSQLSMKLMLSNLPKGVTLSIPDRSDYDFIKRGIYGGRVVAKNGVYEEDILYADVVSLYPSTMRLLEHGYGHATKVKEINWRKHGIYEVELTCKSEPSDYMEFLPFRDTGGKLSYAWRPRWIGVYSTYDLIIAKDQGYNIKCLKGIEYAYSGYLFNDFIDRLFKLKSENTGVIRMVAKIALNGGGYGKFVQKPIDINSIIVPKTTLQQFFENEDEDGKVIIGKQRINKPKFYDLDSDEWEKMIIESEGEVRYATQVGVSILSGSRYRLYMLIKSIKSTAPNIDIVYSDTDSIFIRKKSLGGIDISNYFGRQLGQLDNTIDGSLNNVINKIYVAGPKMYGYEYYDKNGIAQNTLRLKGVPAKMLTLDQLKHMANNKNNGVIYSMMQMRKNIINVKSLYIDKSVKQTFKY